MKITKSVLSILAIAISSSAFASSYPEQIQNRKQEIQAELNGSTYDVVNATAYNNLTESLRGESQKLDPKNARILTYIKSNGNSAYSYKLYSEKESQMVETLYDQLSESGLSDDEIYKTIQYRLNANRALNQIRDEQIKAARIAISEFNAIPADAEPTKTKKTVIHTSALQFFGIDVSPTGDFELAKPQSMRDGAEQVAADFKAQENAKAISEFNALQELALKESDPAVKNLIKQAADLKLAGYTK